MQIDRISAVTLAVGDMARSVRFYQHAGFSLLYGGEEARFTSFHAGGGYLNLILATEYSGKWWGRVIFWVDDVDAFYRHAVEKGLQPEAEPRDAEWGERYFHVRDPDGHELSFARPL